MLSHTCSASQKGGQGEIELKFDKIDKITGIDNTVLQTYGYINMAKRLIICNRPFAQWFHFTTTARILFVFPFIFKFGTLSELFNKQKP